MYLLAVTQASCEKHKIIIGNIMRGHPDTSYVDVCDIIS
jgi:hypothetical protein